jgi:hypothetical protein
MPHTGHHGSVVNLGIGSALDDQKARQAPLHAGQCVINDRVIPRHVELELGDDSSAGWNRDGLNTFRRRVRQTSHVVDLVEDFTDHMKRRREVGTADAEEEPYCFTDLSMQRVKFRNRSHRAIEDEIFGPFVQQLLDAEFRTAMLTERGLRINFALHDVKFVVDRRKARLRLDQDQSIHAVGNMLGDHGCRAVIDIKAGNESLERH